MSKTQLDQTVNDFIKATVTTVKRHATSENYTLNAGSHQSLRYSKGKSTERVGDSKKVTRVQGKRA